MTETTNEDTLWDDESNPQDSSETITDQTSADPQEPAVDVAFTPEEVEADATPDEPVDEADTADEADAEDASADDDYAKWNAVDSVEDVPGFYDAPTSDVLPVRTVSNTKLRARELWAERDAKNAE